MANLKDMEGPIKFDKGVELYYDPKKDMFYDEKKKKYVKEKDILKLVSEDEDIEDIEDIQLTSDLEGNLFEALSRSARLQKSRQMKKMAKRMAVKRKMKMKKPAGADELKKRARKMAINFLKKKLLKGKDISKLSSAEKEKLEDMIKKKTSVIKSLEAKFLKVVRQLEKDRRKSKNEEVELTEKISCGCGPDCDHCQGKHSESEVGKKCECCGNEIIKEGRDEEYEKFFQSALKKFGVSSPSELKGDKKKEFFDYIDKNWEGENEEDEEESIEETVEESRIKEETIEEFSMETRKKVHKAMMKKYGDDPYYKQVIDALLSKGTDKMEKAIKSLISIRGNQAFKNLQTDMKSMFRESIEETVEESRIRLSSLMNGGALIYDRDEDPDDDKLATVKVKGNPKKDIKNGDDLVLSLMDKGKSKEKEILKSLKKYYPKSKVVKEETVSPKMAAYLNFLNKNLEEGKKDYEIYHNTFSSAIDEVKKFAKKNGYELDNDDLFHKVGTGPKKPSTGKTNKYHLKLIKGGKEDRKQLHFQVYGMKSQYELNMYIS